MEYSIKEVAAAVKMGAPLEKVIPPGADLTYWQRLIDRYLANERAPRRRSTKSTGGRPRQTRCRLSAAEALARLTTRATTELLDRVNGREAQDAA